MPEPSPRNAFGSLIAIAAVVAVSSAAFAYTAGWLSPGRLTPKKIVDSLAPPGGPALGHRRNHAKGICFTGVFDSNGHGADLSKAQVFTKGQWPALGRFNLATVDPNAVDATARVRGLGLQISTPDGDVWRSAMITAPVFPVATPEGFFELQTASKDPGAMKTFIAGHPEFGAFAAWASSAPWTASYTEESYNSLNSFVFVSTSGAEHAVRWTLAPQTDPVPIAPEDLAKLGANTLDQDLKERVGKAPQRWTIMLTVANAGDPTADPTKAWPAGRRTVDAGALVVQQIEPERDGACRDINFDPTILPVGIHLSDDPFPAARSAAYARSYDLRTAEAKDYPYHEQTAGSAQR